MRRKHGHLRTLRMTEMKSVRSWQISKLKILGQQPVSVLLRWTQIVKTPVVFALTKAKQLAPYMRLKSLRQTKDSFKPSVLDRLNQLI